MAGMTYTEDRAVFEAEFFKPPFLARMLQRTAPYIDGLDDKAAFLKSALDAFWQLRDKIEDSNDVVRKWEAALETAAFSRPRWLVHYGVAMEHTRWVKSLYLGRH